MQNTIAILLILIITLPAFSQNEIRISDITISGNDVTKDHVILREINLKKDSIFLLEDFKQKLKESEQNLNNLKLFNFVKIDYETSGNEAQINILLVERWYFWPFPILEISERNFNSWWNEFKQSKYSDFSRLNYGIYFVWNNFRGRNEDVKIKIRKGFKEQYMLSYMKPYLNEKKTIGIESKIQLFRRKKTFYKSENNKLVYFTNENKFSSRDLNFSTEIFFRKEMHNTHYIKLDFYHSYTNSEILFFNPNYFNNNTNTGSYTKLSYQFINDKRDYVAYPLSGHLISIESSKNFKGKSNVNHFEIIGKVEKHIKIKKKIFLGSSFKSKWSSNEYQPYFAQKGLGFEDYVRSYEHYVIDGQEYWISKSVFKFELIKKKSFSIPYVNMKQFKKSHYSLYLGLFSDLGYVVDEQNKEINNLANSLLFGKGISLDYITYYDKLIRIEFSANHLGEKGVFLHFSNPF